MLGSFVAIPLGQIAVGPVATAIGTRDTLLILAILVVLSVVGMLASRDVRRLHALAPPALPTQRRSSRPTVDRATPPPRSAPNQPPAPDPALDFFDAKRRLRFEEQDQSSPLLRLTYLHQS
jgi:hypothetical protein